jgi:hypothetical protein
MQAFRRRIEIRSRSTTTGGEVRAALEDDFHHFRVTVHHKNGIVSAVEGASPRHPFYRLPRRRRATEMRCRAWH